MKQVYAASYSADKQTLKQLRSGLKALDGMQSVRVNPRRRLLRLRYDENKLRAAEIREVFRAADVEAHPLEASVSGRQTAKQLACWLITLFMLDRAFNRDEPFPWD